MHPIFLLLLPGIDNLNTDTKIKTKQTTFLWTRTQPTGVLYNTSYTTVNMSWETFNNFFVCMGGIAKTMTTHIYIFKGSQKKIFAFFTNCSTAFAI